MSPSWPPAFAGVEWVLGQRPHYPFPREGGGPEATIVELLDSWAPAFAGEQWWEQVPAYRIHPRNSRRTPSVTVPNTICDATL